ncbi:MAG: hypothetical protein PWP16_733 [Eubacteriaceae bacterium]|nr:hypothetical protein [Eubacteriaceae bacterium]
MPITGHRRENFGKGFVHRCNAIKTLSEKYPGVDFVYPMHLNPNVRKPIRKIFGEKAVSDTRGGGRNIFVIEPPEYLPFVFLTEQSTPVLTDSSMSQAGNPTATGKRVSGFLNSLLKDKVALHPNGGEILNGRAQR